MSSSASRAVTGGAAWLGCLPAWAEPSAAAAPASSVAGISLDGWLVVLAATALAAAGVWVALGRWLAARDDTGVTPVAGDRTIRALVIGFIALLILGMVANLVVTLRGAQRDVLGDTRQSAANLAQVLAEQAEGGIIAVETALNVIGHTGQIQATQTAESRAIIDRLITGVVEKLQFVRAVLVLDAEGNLIHDSKHRPDRYNLADRDYFQVLRNRSADEPFIGKATLGRNGVWFIPVSRRIDNADGSFGGAIVAALDPGFLQPYYASLDTGARGRVMLLYSDGSPMHSAGPELRIGQPLPPDPTVVRLLQQADAGVYRIRDPDGIDRMHAYRRVGERPLVVVVGLDVAESLAPWRATATAYGLGSLVFALATLALGLRLLLELRRRRVHQARALRLSRMQAVRSEINALITRARFRDELLTGACRIAVEQGEFGVAWIGRYDAGTDTLRSIASAGEDAAYVLGETVTAHRDIDNAGVISAALRQRQPVPDNDLQAGGPGRDSQPWRRARERGYRSMVALPLFHEGRTIGVLVLLARMPGMFDTRELALLNDLVADMAFALQLIVARERVEYLALYDALTGLPNRTLFIERAQQCLHLADEHGTLCAVAKIDIERFRNINESAGWIAGDDVIKVVATRLQSQRGEDGLVGRTERDHFVFLVTDKTSEAEIASSIDATLHACFDRPFRIDHTELRISARTGVAVYPNDGSDAGTLVRNSETALVKAKQATERLLFYTPGMNARVAESLKLETQLRSALADDQFVLHYQPKLDSRSGAVVGLEALLRWDSPGGLMMPSQFIPMLEETGLILEVGEWAMQQAVRDYRRWREGGLSTVPIAVNVSSMQLRQNTFAGTVRRAVDLAGHHDHGLDLELTESILMTGVEQNIGKLEAIRAMHVHIAMDDFGTGYSSLRYLARLPLDALKIDRSFVVGMNHNDTDREIVSSVILLAHQLHLRVVAEGVDVDEQAQLLRTLDCDEMQGYLFSRPLPVQQIEALLPVMTAVGAGASGGVDAASSRPH